MLRTTLSGCDDGSYRQAFKALLPYDKEEKKRVCSSFIFILMLDMLTLWHMCFFGLCICLFIQFFISASCLSCIKFIGDFHLFFKILWQVIEHIDKISITRKCSFITAASDIFTAKVSGTFKRFLLLLLQYFSTD